MAKIPTAANFRTLSSLFGLLIAMLAMTSFPEVQATVSDDCKVEVYGYKTLPSRVIRIGIFGGNRANQWVDVNQARLAYVRNTGRKPVTLKLFANNPPVYSGADATGHWYPSVASGARSPTSGNAPFNAGVKLEQIQCDSSVISAPARIQLKNPRNITRPLNFTENSQANGLFKGSVDLSKVRISRREGPYGQIWTSRNNRTGNYEILVGPALYNQVIPNPILARQLMHVWQYQRGMQIDANFLFSPGRGNYEHLLPRSGERYRRWEQFNPLQQANIMHDWFLAASHRFVEVNGRTTLSHENLRIATLLRPYIVECVHQGKSSCKPKALAP